MLSLPKKKILEPVTHDLLGTNNVTSPLHVLEYETITSKELETVAVSVLSSCFVGVRTFQGENFLITLVQFLIR